MAPPPPRALPAALGAPEEVSALPGLLPPVNLPALQARSFRFVVFFSPLLLLLSSRAANPDR